MSVYAYQITADSGCDLSLEKCAERGVMPYKMPFTMDGKPMTDGMTEESFREFYDLMRAGGIARTSQINPGEFTEFWRPLAEAGTPVLHISLAAAISGSCDNARSAAAMLMEEYPGWTCRVVDSTNASAGFGLVVLRAADNRDKGLSLADNADELESMVHNTNSIFTTTSPTSTAAAASARPRRPSARRSTSSPSCTSTTRATLRSGRRCAATSSASRR